MDSQFSRLTGLLSSATYGALGLAIAIVIAVAVRLSWGPNLDAFPTVGSAPSSGRVDWGSKSLINVMDIIQEGYERYKSAPFKIAFRHKWIVILSKPEHLEELSRIHEADLSFFQAFDDQVNLHHTLRQDLHENPYHIPVIRVRLNRNIEAMYPEIKDEMVVAFNDILELDGNDWKRVPVFRTVQKIICRTSTRLLVGLPLCRDPNWTDLTLQWNGDLITEGHAIGAFPKFLRPLAAPFFTSVFQGTQRSMQYLGPIIEERLKYMNEYGNDWADKPDDLLSWLMDEAGVSQLKLEELLPRVLFVNFGAIHTTSIIFTHAVFYLAANPLYIEQLREEVEPIVETEGLSKVALGKMRKVDSFLKECQRMEGVNALNLTRKALKDLTLSDGTFIPKGTTIAAPSRSLHHDEQYYENACAFEPFRFADMQKEDGKTSKYQFTSTATEYLPFGHGKHACPGRFFAATELKSMLAHLILTYDVKLEDNTTRPPSLLVGTAIIPDPHAKVLFRRRVY